MRQVRDLGVRLCKRVGARVQGEGEEGEALREGGGGDGVEPEGGVC